MLKIFNTLGRELVNFKPVNSDEVKIYLCGPTVYDRPHLGHGRSAVVFDVIRRYLIYKGFKVKFVSNYTDIDDKMIARAREEGLSVEDLANKIIPIYKEDYGKLNILEADLHPRATEYIDEVLDIIDRLDEGGFVYTIQGDGVYFDVAKYKEYGQLSGQNLEELVAGARVEEKREKRSPQDFVLWKFKKDGEPFWRSDKYGDGRPGWHIECSAMSHKILGTDFDIHAGGYDLMFPHHECEIAQSKCAFRESGFAKYWLHNGFINFGNQKMSKSLGNFKTLDDVFKEFEPRVVRFWYLSVHYRSPIEFNLESLRAAKAALRRLDDFLHYLKSIKEDCARMDITDLINTTRSKFNDRMDSDFDTAGALGEIFTLLRTLNSEYRGNQEFTLSQSQANEVIDFLSEVDRVLGLGFESETTLNADELKLIKDREHLRKSGDYSGADKIRDELRDKGIELEDTPNGTIWKRTF